MNLPGERHEHQWLGFMDNNGRGWAQPDVYWIMPELILVGEAKLTQTFTAIKQVKDLYRPLLAKLYDKPVIGFQICKGLRKVDPYLIKHPTALLASNTDMICCYHYIG
jgi:hypothetical protein|tara:strand:- start:423 stop:746 length:324 start_codon:yes stop_codon:yes gene_type:complete